MAKDKEFNYEYDPVKEVKNGKAEKVVWSTTSINAAVEGLKKGLPLKSNPFIGKNTKLLKPNLVYKRTKEEVDDFKRCMMDPVYFSTKCFLMTPTGLEPCKLRDYQKKYLRHLQEHRFSIYLACRQVGKSFSLLNNIVVLINLKTINFNKKIANLLEKYNYFYVNDNEILMELPLFELFILFNDSFINKIRYKLYKLIYKLELWQSKKNKNESTQMKKAKDILNI